MHTVVEILVRREIQGAEDYRGALKHPLLRKIRHKADWNLCNSDHERPGPKRHADVLFDLRIADMICMIPFDEAMMRSGVANKCELKTGYAAVHDVSVHEPFEGSAVEKRAQYTEPDEGGGGIVHRAMRWEFSTYAHNERIF